MRWPPSRAPSPTNFGPERPPASPWATIVDRAVRLWGAGRWEQEPGSTPRGHLLHLDASLATTLGWRPLLEVDMALAWTVEWWRAAAAGDNLRKLALAQITAYQALLGP